MSLYWYPGYGTGYNVVPPATYFNDQLRSRGPTMELVDATKDGDVNRDFYERFVVQRGKPLMIPESSAPNTPNPPPSDRNGKATSSEIKSAWWGQIFGSNTFNTMPRLKLAAQFEEQKSDGVNGFQDWRVLVDPATLTAFKNLITGQKSHISLADDFKVDCGGNWVPK